MMSRTTNTIAGTIGLMLILLALLTAFGNSLAADPKADRLIAEAREALNEAEYAEAAKLFAESRKLTRAKKEISRAIYWEAFSRSRLRKTHQLKKAAELLTLKEMQFADPETLAESEALAARIYGELAQRGQTGAVREVNERARAEERRVETRVAALQSLLQMSPERAMPILEKIIKDDSPKNRELRRHAVMIACNEETPEFQKLLIGMLDTVNDPDFLQNIIICLSMNPSEEGLHKLMALFESNRDPELAVAIIISLSHMDDEDQSGRVFEFLAQIAQSKDQDPEIRQHAIISLSQFDRENEVLDLLLDSFDTTEDIEIQEAILIAMAQLDLKEADDRLLVMIRKDGLNDEFKAQALYLLGSNGKMSVDLLRDLYLDAGPDSEELKFQVWHLLSDHDDKDKALDTMLDFARNEKNHRLKQEMVFWIGQFDDPRAADFLIEILQGEY